jgi:hypothetical protein
MRLPEFPRFKPIELDDGSEIGRLIEKFPPYSDFNFVSMLSYDTRGAFRVSMLNGNLVVRFLDYITLKPFYSFIGRNLAVATVLRLLEFAEAEGLEPSLRLVPECCFDTTIDQPLAQLELLEDPASFDYIHSAIHMSELTGSTGRNKRKTINSFVRKYPDHCFRRLDLTDDSVRQEVGDLLETWKTSKQRTTDETQTEFAAIGRAMSSAQSLRLESFGLNIGDRLVGFTINEVIHDHYYMGHFGKSDPEFDGLASYLERATAREMLVLGCTLMNNQQDLGIPGLRQQKQSWHPVGFLRKFIVRRCDG